MPEGNTGITKSAGFARFGNYPAMVNHYLFVAEDSAQGSLWAPYCVLGTVFWDLQSLATGGVSFVEDLSKVTRFSTIL